MCSPMAVMAITTVASTAMTMSAQQKQAKFQKGTARYNARVAENEAQATRDVGTEAENIKRRETAELLSKQRAQLGAANIDLSFGSALQLQEDTITLGEVDALRIRSNFDARVASLESRATLTEAQGDFAGAAGQQAAVGTLFKGASATLDTGVADKWLTPNSAAVAGDAFQPAQSFGG